MSAVWERTIASAQAGRLAHALLLGGPRGSGKAAFAAELTAWLLCESPAKPCGSCRSCVQFKAGCHPNAWLLRPSGMHALAWTPDLQVETGLTHWQPKDPEKKRDISVDGVRELLDRIHLSSHYGARKIAVFAPADALNASSEDALLKTLEEPPADTHLLLVAEQWRSLKPTLRSRCQILRFARSKPAAVPDGEWVRALVDVLDGRMSLRIAQGLKRETAKAGLEDWLAAGTAWLQRLLAPNRAGAAPPKGATVAGLQQMLADTVEALRVLDENNASPTLLVESIMIRLSRQQPGRSPAGR